MEYLLPFKLIIVHFSLRRLEYFSNDVSMLKQFMQRCVCSGEDVITHELNLSILDTLQLYGLISQLFSHLPVEECEAQISAVHSFAVINLIVNIKYLWIYLEAQLFIIKIVS
jgi:hypothetical protein